MFETGFLWFGKAKYPLNLLNHRSPNARPKAIEQQLNTLNTLLKSVD
jgi:hypothetical protein